MYFDERQDSHDLDGPGFDRLERLIDRLIGGEAEAQDWNLFESLAAREPALWRRLAREQGLMLSLRRSVSELTAVAARLDLPDFPSPASIPAEPLPAAKLPRPARSFRIPAWTGWAAALALACLWSGSRLSPVAPPEISTAALSPDPASAQEAGSETPRLHYVASTPRDGANFKSFDPLDGISVIYVRHTLEPRYEQRPLYGDYDLRWNDTAHKYRASASRYEPRVVPVNYRD